MSGGGGIDARVDTRYTRGNGGKSAAFEFYSLSVVYDLRYFYR